VTSPWTRWRQRPVIVVPGITATTLHDEYPLAREDLWTTVLRREFERLSMHPSNPRYETLEPALVRPGRLFGLVYDDLIRALRYELAERMDRPVPVFPFPYDWRQDLATTARQLADFVEEVLERTALLRNYRGFRDEYRVDLVGHSMGGLVVCEYLAAQGGRRRVGRVATIATPFRGSVEAVVKLLTGTGNLAGGVPREREREAARSLSSIYHLLPSYAGAVRRAPGTTAGTDLFQVDTWQKGVVDSLGEYIRLHGVPPVSEDRRRGAARSLLESYLTAALAHRRRVEGFDLAAAGLTASDWLVLVGIGEPTRFQITVGGSPGDPWFEISDDQIRTEWPADPASRNTGDETVPLEAALPPFVDERRVIALTSGDFSFWEVKDRLAAGVAGLHGLLPAMNAAQRLITRHLRPDYPAPIGGIGQPVPGVARADWDPPVRP
jgi:hypothetical protein